MFSSQPSFRRAILVIGLAAILAVTIGAGSTERGIQAHADSAETTVIPPGISESIAPSMMVDLQTLPTAPDPATTSNAEAFGAPQGQVLAASGNGSLLEQVLANGIDYSSANTIPPDTQVAAGINEVVETVNGVMRMYDKGGSVLYVEGRRQEYKLTDFLGIGHPQTDNRVVFDALHGHYIMVSTISNSSGPVSSTSGSHLVIAVTRTDDPTGLWCFYYSDFFNDSQHILDQPKIGFSNDELMIAAFDSGGFERWAIADLAPLEGCVPAGVVNHQDDKINLMPAVSLTDTSHLYAAYQLNPQRVGILAASGTAAAHNITVTEQDLTVRSLTAPPRAREPYAFLDTGGDTRYMTAVFQNNQLWLAANVGCTPNNDTQSRACMRFTGISLLNGASILTDTDLGTAGKHQYYPALSFDHNGNLFFTYTESSSSEFPAMVVGATSLPLSNSYQKIVIKRGDVNYQCDSCSFNQWGDYSGAATDPVGNTVWLAAEWGADSAQFGYPEAWNTTIAALTLDAPTITSVSPASGAASGGDVVDVYGSGFVAPPHGGTEVYFGGVQAEYACGGGAHCTVNHLQVRVPSHAPATVPVVATTANGSSNGQTTFTFQPETRPEITGLTPEAGPAAGGTTVHIHGLRFTGATIVDFGDPTSFTVNSDTDITLSTPPHQAGLVGVSVYTPIGGWSGFDSHGNSISTHYTYCDALGPPRSVYAQTGPGDREVTVSWLAPVCDGGSAVTYTVTASGGQIVGPVSDTQATVTGLPDGTPVTFTVKPANASGDGPSAVSNETVPLPVGLQAPEIITTNSPDYPAEALSFFNGGDILGVASGGVGTITVGQYPSTPHPGLSTGTAYFDVLLSQPNTFTSVTITDCNLAGGTEIEWLNPTTGNYEPISPRAPPPSNVRNDRGEIVACITFTLNSTSTPSLSQLTGTVIAVDAPPPPIPLGGVASYPAIASGGGSSGALLGFIAAAMALLASGAWSVRRAVKHNI